MGNHASSQTRTHRPAPPSGRRSAAADAPHGHASEPRADSVAPAARDRGHELSRIQIFGAMGPHPPGARAIATIPSSGQPLDGAVRARMERLFAADFADVRLHTDRAAARAADDLGAAAYTVGRRIVFGTGAGDGGRAVTDRVLAHELAHVVQQRPASTRPGLARVVDDAGLERRAHAAAHAAARGIPVGDPGRTHAGRPVVQRQPKSKTAPPAGGSVFYVGMNNFAPEVAALRKLLRGTGAALTAVTLTGEESKTRTVATSATTFDLTTDSGIDDFTTALGLDAAKAKAVAALLKGHPDAFDRDDMAHVIAVYAETELDGKDRLSRVVLSGHSRGESVFAKGAVRGNIYFSFLVSLASIFPKAAGQTKHLMGAACLAGEEETVLSLYKPAFPNLVTYAGWTDFSPTGSEGVDKVRKWVKDTNADPTTLPKPGAGEATWEGGTYHGALKQQSPEEALKSVRFQKQVVFDDYFSGDKAVVSTVRGDIVDFYVAANRAANRTISITGVDHDEMKLLADQAFRLRFWKFQVANFWRANQEQIEKGYGTAAAPAFGRLSRKEALKAIADFPSVANGSASDKDAAQKLLDALRDLDVKVLHDDWVGMP